MKTKAKFRKGRLVYLVTDPLEHWSRRGNADAPNVFDAGTVNYCTDDGFVSVDFENAKDYWVPWDCLRKVAAIARVGDLVVIEK